MFLQYRFYTVFLITILLSLTVSCGETTAPTAVLRPTPAPTSTFTPVPMNSDSTVTISNPKETPTAVPTVFSPSALPTKSTLIISETGPVTLDPVLTTKTDPLIYVGHIFSGLVKLESDLTITPDIAKKWEILDNGRRYLFHLNPDAKFHSGKSVTAQDVKDSLERATDPATKSQTAQVYLGDILGVANKLSGNASNITGITVINDTTVQILVDNPKPYFLTKLAYPVASIVDTDNTSTGPDWFHNPNGTGPFKLKVWEKEKFLVLERNQNYHLGAPNLEFVNFRFLSAPGIQGYESGEIDIARINPSEFKQFFKPNQPLRKELISFQKLSVFFTGFDSSKPPFDDPSIRRAFALSLDRDKLTEIMPQGSVQKANGFLPEGILGHTPNFPGIPYNPEEARKLLSASQYGGPAKLPQITYTVSNGNQTDMLTKSVIQMWQTNLNVEVKVRQVDSNEYLKELTRKPGEIFNYLLIAAYPDPESFLDNLFRNSGTTNVGKYTNELVNSLLGQGQVEQIKQPRVNFYRQVQQTLLSDVAGIPLWYEGNYMLIKPYVKGYSTIPQGFIRLTRITLER